MLHFALVCACAVLCFDAPCALHASPYSRDREKLLVLKVKRHMSQRPSPVDQSSPCRSQSSEHRGRGQSHNHHPIYVHSHRDSTHATGDAVLFTLVKFNIVQSCSYMYILYHVIFMRLSAQTSASLSGQRSGSPQLDSRLLRQPDSVSVTRHRVTHTARQPTASHTGHSRQRHAHTAGVSRVCVC